MSSLLSLPEEVFKLVVQRIPVKDRLASCCLVNRGLHAAAVAVTKELQLGVFSRVNQEDSHNKIFYGSSFRAQSFLGWLAHYGQHLTSLKMHTFPEALTQLACPNLLELIVEGSCSVQLAPSADGLPGVAEGCLSLTQLELQCDIVDAPDNAPLHGLSSLVHLQHLFLMPNDMHDNNYDIIGLSPDTLPSLEHLTHLRVRKLDAENLLQLAALTRLQELELDVCGDNSVGPISVPDLAFPASLTQLWLMSTSPIEAGVLELVPTSLQELWIVAFVEGIGNLFLSGMARLSHLTELSVEVLGGLDWPPAGPAYSALTASSDLVSLALTNCKLPEGVWPYMFPASRRLPHLTSIFVETVFEWGFPELPFAWCAEGVSGLVTCCPNLQEVQRLSLQHGSHVSELHKLTALTELLLGYGVGISPAFESSMKGLAAVTQLKDMILLLDNEDLPEAALLPLTALTSLTRLDVYSSREEPHVYLRSDAVYPDPSDVWLQLLEQCTAAPGCQHVALRSLAQQLAQQRVTTAQQLAELRGIVTQQQQQVNTQQEQIAAQQQQIAMLLQLSAQQVAFGQGGHAAGLQVQP